MSYCDKSILMEVCGAPECEVCREHQEGQPRVKVTDDEKFLATAKEAIENTSLVWVQEIGSRLIAMVRERDAKLAQGKQLWDADNRRISTLESALREVDKKCADIQYTDCSSLGCEAAIVHKAHARAAREKIKEVLGCSQTLEK